MKTFWTFLILVIFGLSAIAFAEGETTAPVKVPTAIDNLLEYKKAIQHHYESRLMEMLNSVVGPENSEVRVNVEVTASNTEETISDFDPEKSVVVNERLNSKDADAVQYETKKIVTKKVAPFGSVKTISVAALISDRYFSSLNDDEKNEAMSKIDNIIRKTVGFDASRGDSIAILPTKLNLNQAAFIPISGAPRPYFYYFYLGAGVFLMILFLLGFMYFDRLVPRQLRSPEEVSQILSNQGSGEENISNRIKVFARNHPEQTVQALRKILRS